MYRDETKNLVGINKVSVSFTTTSPVTRAPMFENYFLNIDLDNTKGLFTAKSDMYRSYVTLGSFDLYILNVPSGVSEINLNINFVICLYYAGVPMIDENGIPTKFYDTKILPIRDLRVNEGTNQFNITPKTVDISTGDADDYFIDIPSNGGLYIVVDGWVV